MCGIVGYVGSQQAAPILLDGLSKLEYRGYDSAGLAVRNGTDETEVIKAKGRLKVLFEKTNGGAAVPGTCGIGHTRWATHGEPSENNAHPHMSDDGNVVAVHNGIIENYQELKNKLLRKGYTFYSETDTEVAVKLIDYYYKSMKEHRRCDQPFSGPYSWILCACCDVQGLSGRNLCGKKRQSDDSWRRRWREFYCIRCAGYFEILQEMYTILATWRWQRSAKRKLPSTIWMVKKSRRR